MSKENLLEDVCDAVPEVNEQPHVRTSKAELELLAAKLALTIREAALLGLGSERQLRQLIRDGVIRKAVLRTGHGSRRKKVRLAKDLLVEELRLKS